MAETPDRVGDVLASGYYRVRYTYPGSSFEATSTDLGAYSSDEAGERVQSSVATKDVTILSVTQLGDSEPVTCTYSGGDGAVYPDGPWVWMDWVDRFAPLIVCDVHGHPAHPCVYESDPDDRHYTGPCQYHPEPWRTSSDLPASSDKTTPQQLEQHKPGTPDQSEVDRD